MWGTMRYFRAYLKSVIVNYTLFGDGGRPVRATVDLILEETPDDAAGQNPTSGGIAGRSATVVQAGDSLASIAYREYGKARLWRALALANDIEDPLALLPGTALLVPSAAEAARLEADGA
jgi:nucleoid-associated protein YgaU